MKAPPYSMGWGGAFQPITSKENIMQLDSIRPEDTLEDATAAEPITFQIVGYLRGPKGKVTEETYDFQCSPDAPYGEFLDFLTEAGQPGAIRRAMNYIEAALVNDEERARLVEVLHTPNLRLNPKLIDLLATGLVEAYTERPTSPRSASPSGGNRAARRSTAGAGSRASATSRNGRPAQH